MNLETDGGGKRYCDIPTLGGEHVRITFVPEDQAGYEVDCVRIQIRDNTGHLRQGPEVPLLVIGDVYSSIIGLLMERRS